MWSWNETESNNIIYIGFSSANLSLLLLECTDYFERKKRKWVLASLAYIQKVRRELWGIMYDICWYMNLTVSYMWLYSTHTCMSYIATYMHICPHMWPWLCHVHTMFIQIFSMWEYSKWKSWPIGWQSNRSAFSKFRENGLIL